MKRSAAVALLLSALPAAAHAQGTGPDLAISCPPTLALTYGAIAQLPFEGREYNLAGFKPAFAAATVRLIEAEVTQPADEQNERLSGMAENEMTAKPGQPLNYVIWSKGAKAPDFPAVVSCGYEGGIALQRPLPATVRGCILTYAVRKTDAGDPSTRRIYTKADFACR
ncbi:hypothetical protein [Aquabacter cavernae]|uniref:hypothetical protein n=1 Tax=Aquabacter cavernae TaxID=2496029 RepID=UPI000F8C35FA|nr:hypothetical protein [Aquabacter cavernae]